MSAGRAARADSLSREVIGAAIEVHRHLGPGFLEATYEEALALELSWRDVVYRRQVPIVLNYKAQRVGTWRVDLLVSSVLVVELKSVRALNNAHRAQVVTYLKTLNLSLGLLINFNVPMLSSGVVRVVHGGHQV